MPIRAWTSSVYRVAMSASATGSPFPASNQVPSRVRDESAEPREFHDADGQETAVRLEVKSGRRRATRPEFRGPHDDDESGWVDRDIVHYG
jgi:hypothetical protein